MRKSVTARALFVAFVVASIPIGVLHADEEQTTMPAPQVATTAPSMTSARVPVEETSLSTDSQPASAASAVAAPASTDAYVPKTQYDNTPYRFNAGNKFSAAEFDAWMASRGIRVAKGNPAAATAPATLSAGAPSAPSANGGESKATPAACAPDSAVTAC